MWTSDINVLCEASKVIVHDMHAMRCHVPSFLRLYRNFAHFDQQGLEEYNDQESRDFFRSTNHKGEVKNRVQYLQALEAEQIIKNCFCSNCSTQGRSIKKCTNMCSDCSYVTCRTHLTKQNGKWVKRVKLLIEN